MPIVNTGGIAEVKAGADVEKKELQMQKDRVYTELVVVDAGGRAERRNRWSYR